MHFRSTGERDAFAQNLRAAILRAEGADHAVLARLCYRDWVRDRAIAEYKAAEARLVRLRAELRDVQLYLQYRRKYRPDQPRVPAGNPDGGQWTDEGGSSGERRRDEDKPDQQEPDSRDRTQFLSRDVENSFLRPEANPSLDRMPWRDSFGQAPDGTPIEEAGVLNDRPVRLRDEQGGMHGGHTLDRHVGRSDNSLITEYLNKREVYEGRSIRVISQISPVGSFDSEEAANDLANQLIKLKRSEIEQALRLGKEQVSLEHRFGFRTGREAWSDMPSSEPYIRDTYSVWMVLWIDRVTKQDYRIRTFFPYNRGWKE